MTRKPSYEELEQRVKALEEEIVKHKKIEVPLLESEAFSTSLLEHSPNPILVLNQDTSIKYVNPMFEELTGYTSKEVIGKKAPFPWWIYDSRSGNLIERKEDILKDRQGIEKLFRKKNGALFWVEINNAIIEHNEEFRYNLSNWINITERKRSEEVLQKGQKFLQDVFDAIKDGISVLSLNLKIVRVNSWMEKMYSKEGKLTGRKCYEVYQKRDTPCPWCPSLKTIETGETHNAIVPYPSEENPDRWIGLSSFPLRNIEGNMVGVIEYAKDITQQKRTEEALRIERDNLKNIFEAIEDGIYIINQQYDIQYVNPVLVKDFGPYEGVKCYEYFHDRNKICPWCKSQDVWAGKTVRWEWYSSKNDRTYDLIDTPMTLSDESIGKLEIFRDITDRKRVEKEIKSNEARFRELFNNMRSGVAVYEAKDNGNDFIFKDFNRAGEQIEKIKKENVIGESVLEIFPGVNKFGLFDVFKRVWETGKPEHYPISLYKDARIVGWRENFVYKLPSGEIVAVYDDVTERKKAKDKLKESEEKYRSMMEAMKDPVYICSPNYRVEYMNQAMIKRIGRDSTGEYCFKAIHGLDEKCSWCMHDKTQKGKRFESDIVSPKDNRSYHVSHSPIVHEDGSISKMTVYRDTTDLKKMETQLQQAQKMEAIGTLAGGIAHDFNNILFPMFGYLEMMLEDVPADDPLHGHLAEVFNGAKRSRDLVKQMLTFSRQTDLEKKPLKVQLVIKEVLKLIRSSLPTTIGIRQDISNECDLVMADPTQIHQIAMNLITNAYHAMEETGGKLTVNLKEVELTTEDLKDPAMVPGQYVCLTVADTGPGMDQGIIARIFDPYFTTKEEGKGTGLGLAIVHGIVKSHGGHISVYSEPGKGTEFQVYLPVIKPQEAAQSIEADLPIQKGDERILLVDDQEFIVDIEKQMLERLGYHVTARISSPEALKAFKANPNKFDLVITDLTMPNMTGDRLAGELINIRSDIPVILCTGFSEMMSKEKAESLGIKGFLMKPIIIKDLSKIIRDVLDNK